MAFHAFAQTHNPQSTQAAFSLLLKPFPYSLHFQLNVMLLQKSMAGFPQNVTGKEVFPRLSGHFFKSPFATLTEDHRLLSFRGPFFY